MHNGLVVVTFQLVDHPLGAGGLAVVPGALETPTPPPSLPLFVTSIGSFLKIRWFGMGCAGTHKGNVSAPQEMRRFEKHQEFVKQPETKAGDVSPATVISHHRGLLTLTAAANRLSSSQRCASCR